MQSAFTCSKEIQARIRDLLIVPLWSNLAQLSNEQSSSIRHILGTLLLFVDSIKHFTSEAASEIVDLAEVTT